MLEPQYDVEPQVLGDGSKTVISNGVLMVDADLRKAAPVEQLKLALHDLRDVSEKLFVVQKHLHHMVAQAFALGATERGFPSKGNHTRNWRRSKSPRRRRKPALANASPEITHSAAVFGSMFTAIRDGRPFKLSDAENATTEIINGIEQNGLELVAERRAPLS